MISLKYVWPKFCLIALFDKLSDLLSERQCRDKVRNFLQEMAHEDRIENVGGRGNGALWIRKNQ